MSRTRPTWKYVSKEATTDQGFSVRDFLAFHYFNPNGAYADLQKAQQAVDAYVDATPSQPNGAKLAYGTWDHYHSDRLSKLCLAKRPPSRIAGAVAVGMLRESAQKSRAWLASKEAGQ